jgi:hypothetical protein
MKGRGAIRELEIFFLADHESESIMIHPASG